MTIQASIAIAALTAALLHFGFARPWQRLKHAPDTLARRPEPHHRPSEGPTGEHPAPIVDLAAVRVAVERAELRRRGVTPLIASDPEREELEDRLLAMVEHARERNQRRERAASRALYPTHGRDIVALPTGTPRNGSWS